MIVRLSKIFKAKLGVIEYLELERVVNVEIIIGILIVVILLGIIYMIDSKNAIQNKTMELSENLVKETEENQKKQRVIERLEYDRKIKNCELDDMLISKNITHHIKGNKKIRVLVGDYYLSSVRNTCGVLMKMGFEVDVVERVEDIIELIENGEKYDLIITNNEYYGNTKYNSGTDVLDNLKELPNFKTPIIILTTSNKREMFIAEGFDEHIQKILNEEKVMDVFPKVLKNLKFETLKKQ